MEHHTEVASAFGVVGALGALLADTPDARALRRGRTWLLLPQLDPDGHAAVQFERLTDRFLYTKPTTPPEILAYARYFTAYIASGRSLDLAVALHNVEATECPPLFNPFRHLAFDAETQQFTRALLPACGPPAISWAIPTPTGTPAPSPFASMAGSLIASALFRSPTN